MCCYAQKSVLNIKKNVSASLNLPKQHPQWLYLGFCAVTCSNFWLLNFQWLHFFFFSTFVKDRQFLSNPIHFSDGFATLRCQKCTISLVQEGKSAPQGARHTAKIAKGARGAPGKKNSQWGEKTKFSLHCVCCYTQKSVLNIKKIVPASPNLPKQQAQLVLPGVLYCSII